MKFGVRQLVAAGLLLTAVPLRAQPAVRGQVLDQLGRPLAGARVELILISTGYEQSLRRLEGREPLPAATTDTDGLGRYLLGPREPGIFAVRVSAAGRIPLTFEPLPLVEETELLPAALPEDVGVALAVRDATGRPAAGVWVLAEGEGDTPLLGGWQIAPRIGRTAVNGSLTLPRLANEKLRVRMFPGAGTEEVREAFLGGDLRLGTAVLPERKLRVVDARGQGMAGVLVRLGEASWPAGLTDGNGRLAIRAHAEGGVRVRLASVDGRRLATNLEPRAAAANTEEEILVLEDAPAQTGRVRQEEDGRPLAGALVWLGADPGAFSLTDTEGRYRVLASKGSTFWLEANAPGRLPKRILLRPLRSGAESAPTLALAQAGEIVGRVVAANGASISAARVSALPASEEGGSARLRREQVLAGTATGADGSFRLGRLRPGELYSVQAAKAGFLPSKVEALALASGGRRASIVLAPTRAASGRILDTNGRPLAGAEVRLAAARALNEASVSAVRASRRREPPDAVSDPRGRFTVAAIPALALDIEVLQPGYSRAVVRNFKVLPGTGPVDLGTIILRQGGAVTGIVVDGRGKPISGARVFRVEELRAPSELAERLRDETPEATTRADGRFSLSDQPRDLPIHLLISARGFLPATLRGVRPPISSLRIRLEDGTRFVGRVLDPERLPVADANVALAWQATAPGRDDISIGLPVVKTATTGRDGRFEVADMPAGRGTLAASAAGFVAVEEIPIVLPQAPGGEETVVLARGSTLEGRVSTTTGDPVAGVRIAAGPATGLSDDDGVFRIDGVPTGRVAVEAFHPDYPRYRRRLQIKEGINRLEVMFEAGSIVRGRVMDEAGEPVVGATAILQAEARSEAPSYRARTDADGIFTLKPVAAGRYRLGANAHGYMDAELEQAVTVGREAVEGLDIVLKSGGTITGHILGLTADELSRVAVRAEHESGESMLAEVDAAGQYALRHLRAGGWLIQASLIDGQRHARARVLLAASGEETQDLRFGGRLILSGKVLYRDQALADALVSIRGQHLAVERSSTTDYDGAFRFEDLEADTYWLGLNQPSELLVHNETIELASDREVTIRLERETVAGTVKDAASEDPIADAIVSLRHLVGDDGPEFLIADASDTSGVFRLDRVPPGRYSLKVDHEGYSPAERQIEVAHGSDLQGVEVPLQPSGGADLFVRSASGETPTLLHLRLLSSSGAPVLAESRPVGSGGKVRLSTVPAGSWVLLAASERGALSSAHLTVPGKPVALILPTAARLVVRVPSLATSDAIATVSIVGADGQAFQTLGLGGILEQSWPLVAGRAAVEAVPAGNWVVSAMTPDGRTWSMAVTTDGHTNGQVDLE